MIPEQPRWQCSIRALLIVTSATALGLVVLRAFLVHGDTILAGIIILAIPVLTLAMVMHMIMLGVSDTVAVFLPASNRKSTSRVDPVQH